MDNNQVDRVGWGYHNEERLKVWNSTLSKRYDLIEISSKVIKQQVESDHDQMQEIVIR
jgi:hypothetical protein